MSQDEPNNTVTDAHQASNAPNPLHALLTTPTWSIDTDEFLLDYLHHFANKYTESLQSVQKKVDALMDDVDRNEVMMLNVMNEFDQLKITQFMEHRVYEDDMEKSAAESATQDAANGDLTEEEEKQKKQEAIRVNFLKALKYGEEALEKYSVVKDDNDANGAQYDSDEYDDDFDTDAANAARNEKRAAEMAQIHELFRPRKLPYLIGSREFMEDDMCGLEPQDDPDVVPTDALLQGPQSPDDKAAPQPNGENPDAVANSAPPLQNGEAPPALSENAPPPPPAPENLLRPPAQSRPSFDDSEDDSDKSSNEGGFNLDDVSNPKQTSKKNTDDLFSSSNGGAGELFNPEYKLDEEDDVFDLDELENQFSLPTSKKAETKPAPKLADEDIFASEPQTTTIASKPKKQSTGFSFFDDEDEEDDLTDILDISFKPKPKKEAAPAPAKVEEPKPAPPKVITPATAGGGMFNDIEYEDDFAAAKPVESKPPPAATQPPAQQTAAKKSFFDDDLFGDEDDDDLLLGGPKKTVNKDVDLFGGLNEPKTTTTTKKSGLLDDFDLDIDDFAVPQDKPKPQEKKPSVSFGKPTTNLFAGMDSEDEEDPIFGSAIPKTDSKPKETTPAPIAQPPKETAPAPTATATETKKAPAPADSLAERKRAISSAMESSIMQGLMGGRPPQKLKKPNPLPTSTKTTFDGGISTRDHIDHVNLNKPKRKKRARRVNTIQPIVNLPDTNGLSLPGESKKPATSTTTAKVDLFSDLAPSKTKAAAKKPSTGLGDMFTLTAKPKAKTTTKKSKSAIDDDIFGSPMPVTVRTKKNKNEKQLKAAQALAVEDPFADFSSKKSSTSTTSAAAKKDTTTKRSTTKAPAAALDPFADLEPKKKRKSVAVKDVDLFGPAPSVSKPSRRASTKKATDDLDDIFGPTTSKKSKKSTKKSKGDDLFGF